MSSQKELLQRLDVQFKPNSRRVVCLPHNHVKEEVQRVLDHLLNLDDAGIKKIHDEVQHKFAWRHRDISAIFDRHFELIREYLPVNAELTEIQKAVLSSYFTKEYSIEATALFNPSIVPHPDQSGMAPGSARFVLTLRATGEGHISSVEFMSGTVSADMQIELNPVSRYASVAASIEDLEHPPGSVALNFDPDTDLSERVVFPVSEDESNGIEDVRMVRFEDEEESLYYGTFTAYDGRNIKSKLMATEDFIRFKIYPLGGEVIKDKGMALFSRKIGGRYAMISRQDGVNLWIMFSDNLLYWEDMTLLKQPEKYWEFGKIGNCGSPMEIEQGWLLLTHGVGPMRKYEIGICLLDKHDPSKVIANLNQPLISPNEEEREGYVPNVVYTGGAMVQNDTLIIPYAMSDSVTGFGIVDLNELLGRMEWIK